MKATNIDAINHNAIAQYLMVIMGGSTLISGLLSPFFVIVGLLIFITKKTSMDLPSDYLAYYKNLKKTLYFVLGIYVVIFSMPFILAMLHGNPTHIKYLAKYGQEVTSFFLFAAGIYHYLMLKKCKTLLR